MTIYALSSGAGLSGVAVIRISGSETENVILTLTKKVLPCCFSIDLNRKVMIV